LPIDQSCVGYWKMDDASGQTTIKDYSYSGNDGSSANNKVDATDPWGVSDGAMTFNGSSDYVSKTSPTTPYTTAASFTLWIKADTIGSISDYFFTQPSRWGVALLRDYGPGFSYWVTVNTTDYRPQTLGPSIIANMWYHIALTFGSQTLKFYVDGVEVDSRGTVAGNLQGSTDNITIGNYGPSPSATFGWDGIISDVRIYNRALSSREIKSLYMSGRS